MKKAFALLTVTLAVLILCLTPALAVVCVKYDSPGPTFDGNSWETAYHTIQAGVDDAAAAGEEVRVSAGTYAERVTLKSGVALNGGYSGSGAERNIRAYATSIVYAGYTVMCYANTSVDGFVVEGGITCLSAPSIISHNILNGKGYSGVYAKSGYGGAAEPSVTIAGNIIYGCGTGVYIYHCNAAVSGNLIYNNFGNGISLGYDSSKTTTPTLTVINNTIALNVMGIDVGLKFAKLANNLIAYNGTGIRVSSTQINVRNNVYGNDINYDPYTASKTGNISVDPQFVSLEKGDFHIRETSLCCNAGDDASADMASKDMDGQARKVGSAVDIGADESYGETYPFPVARIVYVNASAASGGDGTTWDKAYQTVQAAMNDVTANGGADVYVAQGTYTEDIVMSKFARLYGGFAVGDTIANRDPKTKVTTLQVKTTNVYQPKTLVAARITVIDGFSFLLGSYGVYCIDCSPVISNNIFYNPVPNNGIAPPGSWGVYAYRSSALIQNNAFTGTNMRSGVTTVIGSPVIIGNAFLGNYRAITLAGGEAAIGNNNMSDGTCGILTESSPKADISGNIICRNSESGIYSVSGGGAFDIRNNTLVGNGNAICITNPMVNLTNNIIASNVVGVLIPNTAGSMLSHNIVYGNTTNYKTALSHPSDIAADPLFVNKTASDFRVPMASPAVDSADQAWASETDFNGTSRPIDANGDGIAIADIGAYEAPGNCSNPFATKGLADGCAVGVGGIVTAVYTERFYLESADRSGGIGVIGTGASIGMRAIVYGTMYTVTGERVIKATSVSTGPASSSIKPFHLNPDAFGGGPLGLQNVMWDYRLMKQADGTYARQAAASCGANNIGILVKMNGKVSSPGVGFFYLSGSANFDDGTPSIQGIRVYWPFTNAKPSTGSFIEITGISSCTAKNDKIVRMLRPVSASSWRSLE